jgi:hypothetical protein
MKNECFEYNILGSQVKLDSTNQVEFEQAQNLVQKVIEEASKFKQSRPNLTDKDIAVLLMLRYAMAADTLRTEISDEITSVEASIAHARDSIKQFQSLS